MKADVKLISRRTCIKHVAATAITAGPVSAAVTEGLDPRSFGAAFDGRTDDTEAWRRTIESSAASGQSIKCPPGTTVLSDTLLLKRGMRLRGAGIDRTFIRTANSAARPSLYLFDCESDVRVSDLCFELENVSPGASGHWVAALGFVRDAKAITCERVAFTGKGHPRGLWSGFIAKANIENAMFNHCEFERLEAAIPVKDNANQSHQTGWAWADCHARDCIDAFSINSPSGSWSNGTMLDCTATNTAQFPFALAGPQVTNWTLRVSSDGSDYECLHVEDGASQILVSLKARNCNRKDGVVGSPRADNGVVQIIGGAHDINIALDLDLGTATRDGYSALVVQAGGKRVSDDADLSPFAVGVSGGVRMSAGRSAIVAYDSRLHFDGLTVNNTNGDAKKPLFSLSGCTWAGTAHIIDPGLICYVDPRSSADGAWDDLLLTSTKADGLPGLAWTNAPLLKIANRVRFEASFSGTILKLGPPPRSIDGPLLGKASAEPDRNRIKLYWHALGGAVQTLGGALVVDLNGLIPRGMVEVCVDWPFYATKQSASGDKA